MSPLTSQSDLLRSLVFGGEKPSNELMKETGLDVELLEKFVADLKPSMDYLRGYRSLDEFYVRPDGERKRVPYPEWLEESGLSGQHTHCILLLDAAMYGGGGWGWYPLIPSEHDRYEGEYSPRVNDNHQRYAHVRVFLTRRGKWIVWVSYPTSVFRVKSDVRSALKALADLTPPGVDLRNYTDKASDISSPALYLTSKLVWFFRESIDAKKNDVRTDEGLLQRFDQILGRFS